MIIFIIIAVAFIGLVAYGIISKRKRRQAMAALAAQKGWTALSNDGVTLNQYLPQYIQTLGQQNYGFGTYSHTNSSYDMAYQATVGGHEAVLFQYEYTEHHQNGDPQQPDQSTTYYFTILNLSLPIQEPTIMLLHHSFASRLTNFGLHNGLQKISLEGNFDQFYDTYIAQGSEVEALSLLTPDVMEKVTALAGPATNTSLQMSGQRIIISFEKQLMTPEFIQPLLDQVATLLAKLDVKPQVTLQAQVPVSEVSTNLTPGI